MASRKPIGGLARGALCARGSGLAERARAPVSVDPLPLAPASVSALALAAARRDATPARPRYKAVAPRSLARSHDPATLVRALGPHATHHPTHLESLSREPAK